LEKEEEKWGKVKETLEIAKRIVGKGRRKSGKCIGKMGRQKNEGKVE
jgi:hypothetical protein